MKRLFYVRHGETHHNAADLFAGQSETSLTDKGKQQAVAAGQQAESDLPKIDLMIASPYERTFDTAKLIAQVINYPTDAIETNDLFVERHFGVLEGTPTRDFFDNYERHELDKVENAETVEQLQQRAAKALAYLFEREEDNILVVGHGSFGRALRREVQGLPHTHEYEGYLPINNAEVVELI